MLFHLTQITFCQRTLLLMYLSLGTVTSFISTSLPILVELITLAVLLRFFNFLLGCSHAHCLPISDFFQLLTLVVFFMVTFLPSRNFDHDLIPVSFDLPISLKGTLLLIAKILILPVWCGIVLEIISEMFDA